MCQKSTLEVTSKCRFPSLTSSCFERILWFLSNTAWFWRWWSLQAQFWWFPVFFSVSKKSQYFRIQSTHPFLLSLETSRTPFIPSGVADMRPFLPGIHPSSVGHSGKSCSERFPDDSVPENGWELSIYSLISSAVFLSPHHETLSVGDTRGEGGGGGLAIPFPWPGPPPLLTFPAHPL